MDGQGCQVALIPPISICVVVVLGALNLVVCRGGLKCGCTGMKEAIIIEKVEGRGEV